MLIPDDDAMDHILPCVFHIDSPAFEWKPPDASCLLMAQTDVPLIHNPEKEKSWKAEDGEKEGRSKKEAARGHGRKERISFSRTTFQANPRQPSNVWRILLHASELSRSAQNTDDDTIFFLCPQKWNKNLFFLCPRTSSLRVHRISSNLVEHCRTRATAHAHLYACGRTPIKRPQLVLSFFFSFSVSPFPSPHSLTTHIMSEGKGKHPQHQSHSIRASSLSSATSSIYTSYCHSPLLLDLAKILLL